MNRYKILIEYVGTNYNGWQVQIKGKQFRAEFKMLFLKFLKKR